MVKCPKCNNQILTLSKAKTDQIYEDYEIIIGYKCSSCSAGFGPNAFNESEFTENDTHNYYDEITLNTI